MHHWWCVTNRHIWRNSTIHQLSHLTQLHPPHTSSVHPHIATRLPLLSTEYGRSSSTMASATATTTSNGTATNGAAAPEIILYTNHGCPWAHRAHIALKELGLPYKEEIIDLDRPRDPWYLKVNPVSFCLLRRLPEMHTSARSCTPSLNHSPSKIQERCTM